MKTINFIIDIVENKENLYRGNLRYYFQQVFNAPNVLNYYHNFRHTLHVTCRVYEGAKAIRYLQLAGKDKFRALLIASLFHDFGHTGKTGNDKKQIKIAVSSVKHYLLVEDADILPEIEYLIKMTEFPHVNNSNTLSDGAKILCDADISQVFNGVWMQQILFGLAYEMHITPIKCLELQIDFLSNIKFHTEWAKKTFDISAKIAEVKKLIKILK